MFHDYICGVTGLTCCGCSFYCQHRKKRNVTDEIKKKQRYSHNIISDCDRHICVSSCDSVGEIIQKNAII